MIKNIIKHLMPFSLLLSTAILHAAPERNHACPASFEIQSTNFTSPSIWIGPAMPHAKSNINGYGLGGEKVLGYLGTESVIINHQKGWVCVYETKGGISSITDYHKKIVDVMASNRYLRKYIEKVNKEIDHLTPFVKEYSKDKAVGFIAYVK